MDTWVQVFVVVAAVAIVIQTAMLTALFLQMKRLSERLERFTGELESRLTPILSRVQIFVQDTQPKISVMVAVEAHVVSLSRRQPQKVERGLPEDGSRFHSR